MVCSETVSVKQLRARPEFQSGNGVTEGERVGEAEPSRLEAAIPAGGSGKQTPAAAPTPASLARLLPETLLGGRETGDATGGGERGWKRFEPLQDKHSEKLKKSGPITLAMGKKLALGTAF